MNMESTLSMLLFDVLRALVLETSLRHSLCVGIRPHPCCKGLLVATEQLVDSYETQLADKHRIHPIFLGGINVGSGKF